MLCIFMVNYRRNFVSWGTYFFTAVLYNRYTHWLTEYIDDLRYAFRTVRVVRPFHIEAIVILPEHLHTIWTLPPGDAEYPARWKSLKSEFTRRLAKRGLAIPKRQDGSALVWQRRYWEHTIWDEDDLQRHVDYLHFNSVKHGRAQRVVDWPYSSFHRYVRQGFLPANWGGGNLDGMELGEPNFDD